MLSTKSLGDPELFSGESTAQLVNQFLDKLTEEERTKRIEVESINVSLQTQKEQLENSISKRQERLNKRAEKLGVKISNFILWILYLLFFACLFIGIASFIFKSISLTYQIVSFLILTLLSIFGFSHQFSADSIRKPVLRYVKQKYLNFLEK